MAVQRIGEALKSKGLVTERQIEVALLHQKLTGALIGETLVKLGFISSKDLAETLADHAGIQFVDLGDFAVEEAALRLIPKETAEKFGFIPLDIQQGRLQIGITNPSNIMAIDAVMRLTGHRPQAFMTDAGTFHDTLERSYFFLENPIQERIDEIVTELKSVELPAGSDITSLTDLVIMDGIRRGATDIHVTPTVDVVQLFFRIDGVLQHGHCLPLNVHSGLASRIKILSNLDIAEQRLPQDGSFSFAFLSKSFDIRVSTIPTIYGENIVLRILAGTGSVTSIDKLGFDSRQTEKIRALFQKPHGIILITGPTGSGKTTTLYAALREINLMERNVLTVEDPVEYKLSLVKQSQVLDKVGYDFAMAGRNFMRQDPDVMLLGEIRDEETARIAIRASITGHLVLSTLHTNDAITAIPRLMDLNVDRFLLSSSLLAIFAQRLVRRICRHCREEYPLSEQEMAFYADHGISVSTGFKGAGCEKCNFTGYLGRTVIGEILIVDEEFREMVFSGASIGAMTEAAIKNGMRPLRNEGIIKASQGMTTIEEILRVAG